MDDGVILFLAGDVMTGRGVDQILPHASPPDLHEPFVQDAREYVRLAENATGVLPSPVNPAYIWGDAAEERERMVPDVRIVNLETSVTRSDEYDRVKSIHYRMHPGNIDCLRSAWLDVCGLANNHVLDYGRSGLLETLQTLHQAGVMIVGAGRNLEEAAQPHVRELPGGGRLLIGACAHERVPRHQPPGPLLCRRSGLAAGSRRHRP